MKPVLFPFLAAVILSGAAGCATESALGIPKVARLNPDPPPMCVALRGTDAQASTTEITAAALPLRGEPGASADATARKPSETTVKDRKALVVAKGT